VEVVPSDKPLDRGNVIAVRAIEIDARELDSDLGRYAKAWSTRQWKREVKQYKREMPAVRTMYKRKDRKVRPVDTPLPRGVNPGGGANVGGRLQEGERRSENEKVELEEWRRGGGTKVPRGSRLTKERLSKMQIGTGFLTEEEKQVFINILFEYEDAITFDDSEMGMLKPEIEPPIVIHTVLH
jgi:hypothetical protein